MKRSEIFMLYRENLLSAMKESYEAVARHYGRCSDKIYLWEDGEIETLFSVKPNTGWLQPKQGEDRALYFFCEISCDEFFDPWVFTDERRPEDPGEAEKGAEKLLQELINSYDPYEDFENAIEAIREEEREEEADRHLLNRYL